MQAGSHNTMWPQLCFDSFSTAVTSCVLSCSHLQPAMVQLFIYPKVYREHILVMNSALLTLADNRKQIFNVAFKSSHRIELLLDDDARGPLLSSCLEGTGTLKKKK